MEYCLASNIHILIRFYSVAKPFQSKKVSYTKRGRIAVVAVFILVLVWN